MKTLTLNVPDTLDVNSRDIAMLVSTRLYEQGKLSLGQAAEVAGLTKRIISDTSCFIVLTNICELEILFKVYGQR